MSRHHKTGQLSQKDAQAALQRQIAQAMYDSLEEAEYIYMSEQVSVLHFVLQYASVTLENLIDHFDGNNCEFTIKARNKGKVAMKACDDFIQYFEPLIHPDNKEDWANDYGQLQYLLDNWLNKTRDTYQKNSDAERAKEICRAAALRYHDPQETNLQRTFEAGFREGAAYADIHPIDSVTVRQGNTVKQVPLRELIAAYEKVQGETITFELKGEKK